MDTVFVKPRPGFVVRMPERAMAKLPDAGGAVPLDGYWQARLRDGDVTRADPSKLVDTAPEPAETTEKNS